VGDYAQLNLHLFNFNPVKPVKNEIKYNAIKHNRQGSLAGYYKMTDQLCNGNHSLIFIPGLNQ